MKSSASTVSQVFGMTWPGIEPILRGTCSNQLYDIAGLLKVVKFN